MWNASSERTWPSSRRRSTAVACSSWDFAASPVASGGCRPDAGPGTGPRAVCSSTHTGKESGTAYSPTAAGRGIGSAGIVIRVIDSFDRLARSAYADIEPRAVLPDRVRLRQSEWNRAVERLLVEVLGESGAEAVTETRQVAASV